MPSLTELLQVQACLRSTISQYEENKIKGSVTQIWDEMFYLNINKSYNEQKWSQIWALINKEEYTVYIQIGYIQSVSYYVY